MSLRISRQHWDGLLNELDQARRQRHLLTYRALLERLQFPTPAMQTLAAALEHLAALDAKAEQPLRSSLVISQGASRLPRTGFFECVERLQFPTPAMQTLAAALEHLAALDAKAEQPLRSSLVISQGASRLPRTGFFECVERLGRFSGPSDGVAAASWHASEVVRVFEYEYPESAEA